MFLGNEFCKDILFYIENEIKSSLSLIYFKFRILLNLFRLVEENFILLVLLFFIFVIGIVRVIVIIIVIFW